LIDPLNESILKQARKRIDIKINVVDLREFTEDKHRSVDDTPYGGGPGMILKPEPLFKTLDTIFKEEGSREKGRVVFPSPKGKLFSQDIAQELSQYQHIVFICGHYKAIDQRVIDYWVSDEISIGDYVLSGGEIPALMMIDAIVRLIPGVLGDIESAKTDSFQNFLLDCPYFTRPDEFRGLKVPEVLLSGNHGKIEQWRLREKKSVTKKRRPDLYKKYIAKTKTKTK
jgi:tRNA (guanine37-N1)-methyltransferase